MAEMRHEPRECAERGHEHQRSHESAAGLVLHIGIIPDMVGA
jgi:hypothetical protein